MMSLPEVTSGPRVGGGANRFIGVELDAVDTDTVGGFWAAVLRGTLAADGLGGWRVHTSRRHSVSEVIWINPVKHPRTVKSRVHFDLRLGAESPDALLRAGAVVLRSPGRDPWYVLADPEGNAFCVYPCGPDRPTGIFELVVDSRDPHAQAAWWAAVLGGRAEAEGTAAAVTGATALPWDYLLFDAVPEPKTVPNRMRWHIELAQPDPGGLVKAGATLLDVSGPQSDRYWHLADPEGNEFCAHAAARSR
ncbi:VOC family protein [Dactylosporangium sp. CS-047395]|uniref:VOC family protein n=1 Tax=Dactylosporangium sp. CS-047395 TaxID=3239936 RepID=UPI003D8B1C41